MAAMTTTTNSLYNIFTGSTPSVCTRIYCFLPLRASRLKRKLERTEQGESSAASGKSPAKVSKREGTSPNNQGVRKAGQYLIGK